MKVSKVGFDFCGGWWPAPLFALPKCYRVMATAYHRPAALGSDQAGAGRLPVVSGADTLSRPHKLFLC